MLEKIETASKDITVYLFGIFKCHIFSVNYQLLFTTTIKIASNFNKNSF